MQLFDIAQCANALKTTWPRRYALAVAATVLALLTIVVAIKIPSASADAGAPPRMATAAVGDIESSVLATGILQARDQVNVGAQVSGQVTSLKVALGEHVKKGALIAEIDPTSQKNDLRNAEAALKSLEAQMRAKQVSLQLAESVLQRQRHMLTQDAIARADYENAEAARNMARADVAALEAQIEQARIQADKARTDLDRTQIRAPISGTVVAIVTKEGQTLNSAQQVPTIVKLARLDVIQVKVQISEADVARVKPGQKVQFTLMGEPGVLHHAHMQVVEPVPDTANQDGQPALGGGPGPSAVYYNGLFTVSNLEGKLRIGMTAQVSIMLASAKNVLTIPVTALGEKRGNDGYVVQVLNNGQPQERQVQVGVRDNLNVQIVTGLKAGEQVLLQDESAPNASSGNPS